MSDQIFFNIIRVPEGKMEETVAAWAAISDFMAANGCLTTQLHRNVRNPNILINRATFKDIGDFMRLAKDPRFLALSQVLTDLGVEREAGAYDVISSFGLGE